MSLEYNPDGDRFNQFYMDNSEESTRRDVVTYSNNVHENIVDSIYSMFDIYVQPYTEINLINNTFTNISGLYGVAYIYNSGHVTMINNTCTGITNFGFSLVGLEEVEGATIDGFTISNSIAEGTSDEYFFYAYINEENEFSINQLVVTNTETNDQPLIFIDEFVNVIRITNSVFEEIRISPVSSLIEVSSAYQVEVSNITLRDIHSNEEESSESYIIKLSNLNLESESNSTMEDINIES